MKAKIICLVLIFVTSFLYSVDVDRAELESSLNDTINFVNFSGQETGVVSTADEIRGIGAELGRVVQAGEASLYGIGYRITHIPPAAANERGADIFELRAGARVDHIDNLRRIISAYLESRYGYSREDARILGEFVTIYNAVHRGNLDLFRSRYIPAVTSILQEERIGLSRFYTDWPGATQIVIPISSDAGFDQLSSVPIRDLLDENVEEILRASEDLGIEERIDAVDLIDRTIDEEQAEIEQARAEIQEERDNLAELSPQESEEREEELEQAEEALAEEEAAVTEAQERSDELREQVAEDIASTTEDNNASTNVESNTDDVEDTTDEQDIALGEQEGEQDLGLSEQEDGSVSLLIPQSRIDGDRYYSIISQIDAGTASLIALSSEEIVGREYILDQSENILLAKRETPEGVELVAFNTADLTIIARSQSEISRYSPLVYVDGFVYAVVRGDGDSGTSTNNWYIGRFEVSALADEANISLMLISRSSIAVAEGTALLVYDNKLYVQRVDERFASLDLLELRVSR